MGARGSQDLRSPSPIMAPDQTKHLCFGIGHALNSFIYIQIAETCVTVLAVVRKRTAKLKTKLSAGRQIHHLTSFSVFQRRQQTCKCTLLLDYRSVYRPGCC